MKEVAKNAFEITNLFETYIVNGADMSLSICDRAEPLAFSLCFGLFSNIYKLSSLSSRVGFISLKSGILAPGTTVNASADSVLRVLMARVEPIVYNSALSKNFSFP